MITLAKILAICKLAARNSSSSQNTPECEAPHKQLVTDAQGKTVWEDKSFYEGTVMEGSDTLTWDGSTEGKVIVNDSFVKISDAVITADDCKNGYKYSVAVEGAREEYELPSYDDDMGNAITLGDGALVCVIEDGFTLGEFVFPEKGVYIAIQYAEYAPVIVTIPGYTDFVTTKTAVKPLDEKYLPDNIPRAKPNWNASESEPGHVLNRPFYEEFYKPFEPVTWQGNTDGLENVVIGDKTLYKICEFFPILDNSWVDIARLNLTNSSGPGSYLYNSDGRVSSITDHGWVMFGTVLYGSDGELGDLPAGVWVSTADMLAEMPKADTVDMVITPATLSKLKTLDEKFVPPLTNQSWHNLKDKPFYDETEPVAVKNAASVHSNAYVIVDNPEYGNQVGRFSTDKVTAGDTFVVTVDGVDYEGVFQQQEGVNSDYPYLFGTGETFDEAPVNLRATPSRFGGGEYIFAFSDDADHLVTITHLKPRLAPLDEKFMPTLTSPGGKRYRITVDDSGTLSAAEI